MLEALLATGREILDTFSSLGKELPECYINNWKIFIALDENYLDKFAKCPYLRRRLEIGTGIEPGQLELSRCHRCTNPEAIALSCDPFRVSRKTRLDDNNDYSSFCEVFKLV